MEQKVLISHRYLRIPVDLSEKIEEVNFFLGAETVFQFEAGLFTDKSSGKPDFYAELPTELWIGRELLVSGAQEGKVTFLQADELLPDQDDYPPFVHFAPKSGWINDPCGLCYYQGKYHLYFQHNMFSVDWHNMSWGHAVSEDLLHWEQREEAVLPTKNGPAFTGSALIYKENKKREKCLKDEPLTAGVTGRYVRVSDGKPLNPGGSESKTESAGANTVTETEAVSGKNEGMLRMVPEGALMMIYSCAGGFTGWSRGSRMDQRMVWSLDGETFVHFPEAVIPNISFENRDPKVYRYEDGENSHWYMVLFLVGHDYGIFVSDDLLHWEQTQTFVTPESWECPDLRPLPVRGSSEKKWVFWSPNSAYRVGSFDGRVFTPEQEPRFLYGSEKVYAAQSFANTEGRVLQLPYLSFQMKAFYRHRGCMGVPRELELIPDADGYALAEHLCREVGEQEQLLARGNMTAKEGAVTIADWKEEGAVHIRLEIDDRESFGLEICGVKAGWNAEKKDLFFTFMNRKAILEVKNMDILADRGGIELFINDDTTGYFVPGADEIVRKIVLEGSMAYELFCIR